MNLLRKTRACLLVFALLIGSLATHAQLAVTQLIMKGQSATGFGGFFHGGIPVGKGDEIGLEAGFDYFAPNQSHLIFVPLLAGYRHFFGGNGTGWYIEPFIGYTIGNTDIQKVDAAGNPVFNSDSTDVDQKASGATAGICVGYILPSHNYPVNIGLRFEHVFVTGDPSASLLSLRFSWSLFAARRLQKQ
ncbi:MAG TPA: hypothetical protein VHE54_07885 [Puia sp.]|nr:hypothetical protein [Puia sp.]